MNFKRLVLFAGHYGSGKTNIAVNVAMDLKKEGKDVVIADLDIVNPYYRTKDSEVGGDDRGALALGRYAPAILEENNYEMLLVINFYRPLTKDIAGMIEVMREIELAGGIPFTGIVNNSNLGRETTPQDVIATDAFARQMAEATGLPLRMTTVWETVADEVAETLPDVVPLRLQNKRLWND